MSGPSGMRITGLRFLGIAYQLERPLVFSRFADAERLFGLVLVETDAGITGLGELPWWAPREAHETLRRAVEETLASQVVGADPFDAEALWARTRGRVGAGALDVACWDIKGKALGVPVYQLLGGRVRDRVTAYASGLLIGPTDEVVAEARHHAEAGFVAMKMRIGRDVGEDVRRVAAVRAAIGPDAALMVDANCAYDYAEGLRVGRRLEEEDVHHFEEPLPKSDWAGYGALAAALRVPIAAGELEPLASVHELLLYRGASIVQPDTMATGFTESRKIAALAEAHGVVVAPHAFSSGVTLAAGLQLAAAIPNGAPYHELDVTPNPLRDELVVPPIRHKGGVIVVPDGPGLGIELSPEALNRYGVR